MRNIAHAFFCLGASFVCTIVGCVGNADSSIGREESTHAAPSGVATSRASHASPAPACGHTVCDVGATLDAACDSCALKVCDVDAYCCGTGWDNICVQEAARTCETSCAPATACSHDACTKGAQLATTCDSCVAKICARDAACCTTGWDAQCVAEAASVCGQRCS